MSDSEVVHVDVAVALVTDDNQRVLVTFHESWGMFTLPMSGLEQADRGPYEGAVVWRRATRQSEAAVALIRRVRDDQTHWLAQWNPKWQAYHFVSGHRRHDETFRECLVREIAEELHLSEGTDYRVSNESPTHLEFMDFSQSTQTETRYIMELFNVDLSSGAYPRVAADPANRWLTEGEIQTGQTRDGQPISATMKRLLGEIGRKT